MQVGSVEIDDHSAYLIFFHIYAYIESITVIYIFLFIGAGWISRD